MVILIKKMSLDVIMVKSYKIVNEILIKKFKILKFEIMIEF